MRQHLAHDAGQRRVGERAARREAHSRRRLRSGSDGSRGSTVSSSGKCVKVWRTGPGAAASGPRAAHRAALSRRRNPATIRSSATSAMPPSSPVGGRVRSSTAIVAAAAPRRRRRGAARLPPSGPCAAASPARRAARPRQASSHGQTAQAGRFGVQIVAPRSISACAKSPGRSAGTSASASSRITGFALGSGVLDEEQPRDHALDIAVDRRGGAIEGDRRDRRRRVGADAGQAAQSPPRSSGKRPPCALNDGPGAGVEVAGARVVAEPGPGLHHLLDRRRRRALRPSGSAARKRS